MSTWISIFIQLVSNPAIQTLIKQIEAALSNKPAGQQAMAASDAGHHDTAAVKAAVDAAVAKHVHM